MDISEKIFELLDNVDENYINLPQSDKIKILDDLDNEWELMPKEKYKNSEMGLLALFLTEEYISLSVFDKATKWTDLLLIDRQDDLAQVGLYKGILAFEQGQYNDAYKFFDMAYKDSKKRIFEGFDKYLAFYKNPQTPQNNQNTQHSEMTDEMQDLLDDLCEQGNEEMDNENYAKAIEYFNKAFATLPEPKDEWEASAWLYTSIGDAYFCMEKPETALDNFQHAYRIFGVENLNPFVLLRIGQCYLDLQDEQNAIEFLLRAYMLDGEDVFEGAEEYFDFLKSKVDLTKAEE